MAETPKKHRVNGNDHGKGFTSEKQPTPEQKKQGWQERRAERLLTQKIIEKMTGKPLDEYVDSLILNAKMGNAKAIETINKGIEEQIDKSEVLITKLGKDLADEDYV